MHELVGFIIESVKVVESEELVETLLLSPAITDIANKSETAADFVKVVKEQSRDVKEQLLVEIKKFNQQYYDDFSKLQLYHGTPTSVSSLKLTQGTRSGFLGADMLVDNQAVFLSDSKDVARAYGDNRSTGRGSELLKVRAAIANTLSMDSIKNVELKRMALDFLEKYDGNKRTTIPKSSYFMLLDHKPFVDKVKALGYDSVSFTEQRHSLKAIGVHKDNFSAKTFAVFNPEQLLVQTKQNDPIQKLEDVFRLAQANTNVEDSDTVDESTIDFPQEGLPLEIWDKDKDAYILKPDIKNKIKDVLAKYPWQDLNRVAKEIHITGSIGTNQYGEDTDVDIHIIPTDEMLSGSGDIEKLQKDIFKWYKNNRDDIGAYIDKHPIEVYLQLNPEQEFMSDALYSVLDDKWLVGPTLASSEFDPYEEFKDILKDVRAEASNADELLGELKRDVIDYEVIKQAVSGMSLKDQQRLKARLESKLDEIEKDIQDLMSKKQSWIDMRKAASKPSTPEEALDSVEIAKKWKDKNAIFKFLNRYNYMQLIGDLEKIIADKEIAPEEVNIIQGIVGV